jgi:hypothetical protein
MKTYQKYPILLFCENSNKRINVPSNQSAAATASPRLIGSDKRRPSPALNKIFNKEKNEEKEGQDRHFYALNRIINDVILNFTKSQK